MLFGFSHELSPARLFSPNGHSGHVTAPGSLHGVPLVHPVLHLLVRCCSRSGKAKVHPVQGAWCGAPPGVVKQSHTKVSSFV